MNFLKRTLLIALALVITTGASAASRGFAIFVDSASHANAKTELTAYRDAVKRQNLAAEIVVINPGVTPDSIRSIISAMAHRPKSPIEGMVFVGDIPIPMLLDAQHLTSAFKVVQNPKRMSRSACPSDRFYDDLNLRFDFLSQDETSPLLYYYSMRADSPQSTHPQLYSGRIKSMDFYGRDKYENLRHYLRKLVEVKNRNEKINEMVLFSGSGYNSESILSRIDEKAAHLEQFPWMKNQQSKLSFLDHRNAEFAKYPLMSRMQRPETSLALLHHHGSPDKEYINRYPEPRNAAAQLSAAKQFFRSKIRSAVDAGTPLDSAKARYARNYDVPVHWFDTVMDSASIAADSIYDEQLDLYLHDFNRYTPNARVAILDACYNGAFNNDEYIAGAYIFGDGDCVAVIANTVNSLQDKLPDRNMGLLGLGMRVGNMVKYNPYLESHVIGDPTFAFAPYEKLNFDINEVVASGAPAWKKQLDSPLPAMQAMAVQQLAAAGDLTPQQLLQIMTTSPNYLTRLSALMELSVTQSPEFTQAIALGLNDSYELIRRFSASFAGKNGDPQLIPAIIQSFADDFKGERVNFQLLMNMPLFSYDALIAELRSQRPFRYNYDEEQAVAKAEKNIAEQYSDRRYAPALEQMKAEKPDLKELRQFIRSLRNNPLHPAIDELVDYVYRCPDESLQLTLVEALGWFNYSYRAHELADKVQHVADDERFSDSVRSEARKTVARLRRQ